MCRAISKRQDTELNRLVKNKDAVFSDYKFFLDNYADYLKAGDKSTVNRRIQLVDTLIEDMINAYGN